MESEVIATLEGSKIVIWLKKLIKDLRERTDDDDTFLPILFCDNLGTVDLLHNTKYHKKAKHIEL